MFLCVVDSTLSSVNANVEPQHQHSPLTLVMPLFFITSILYNAHNAEPFKMFNKTETSLISAAKIILFIGITRSYGCFLYVFSEVLETGREDMEVDIGS